MQKTIQAVPKDLLIRVLNKLKPDYEIFNYEMPFEIPTSNLGVEIITELNSQ